MAYCAYRITKATNSDTYGIAINVTDNTNATDKDIASYGGYNLYVNGTANISSNLNVGGTIIGGSFTPTNPLAIEYGGTGATTATNARTNLGITPANIGAKATQTAVSDPTASGNAIVFIDTISQNAQGVINPTKKTIPNASTTITGLVNTDEQSFGGYKTINLRAPKVYDASIPNRYKTLYFYHNSGAQVGRIVYDAGSTTNVTSGRFYFEEISPKSTAATDTAAGYESYSLPTAATGLTQLVSYNILTSKNAVTIAQGGTGATTSANARTNLGLGTAATHAHGDYVTIADAQTITGGKTFSNIITSTYAGNGFQLKHGTASKDCYFYAERTDTGTKVGVGVGSGGINHGVYSFTVGTWMVYANASTIFANIQTFNKEATFATNVTVTGSIDIQTAWGYLRWKKSIGNKDISALIAANNATTTDPARFCFYQYILDSSGNHITDNVYERFLLPAVTTTRTASVDYAILTTKSAVTTAQGGTGKTTAVAAANAFLNSLPNWTATALDTTYFIRQDTSGTESFGKVQASTLFDYMKGKFGTAATHAHGDYVQTTGDQSVAGQKTFTGVIVPQNTVKIQNSSSPGIQFHANASGLQYYGNMFFNYSTTSTYRRPHSFYFREFTYNSTTGVVDTSKFEDYHLPVVNADRSAVATYYILTSKSAVTVGQGGTGATTTANARTNLNIRSTSLYSGTFSSGSTTLTDAMLYQTLLFVGRNSNSVRITSMVPTALITTTSARYQCADDAAYITFYLTKSGNDVTMEYSSRSAASLYNVYGLN